jgi:signal transduction histidine kinase
MTRLLSKPLRAFILYSLVVLATSIPAYYFIIDYIWRLQLDEHNQLVSEKAQNELTTLALNDTLLKQSIELWDRIQPGTTLEPVTKSEMRPDSLYTLLRKNKYDPDGYVNRFRGLSTYFILHGKPYHLMVETNVEETGETIAAITVVTVFFFLLLLGGFIILNKRISTRLWKPFYRTLEKVKGFNISRQEQIQFEETSITEFSELNDALQRLIEADMTAYRQQKEFTENASHELQTPLAIIRSKLDLLLQSSNLTGEQSDIIEQATRALSRVSRINRNLLLLARIENNQFADRQSIDLSEIVNENLLLLDEHLSNKGIDREKDIDDNVAITGNKTLVETLVSNLLLNAIRHSPAGGKLKVQLSARQLRISNSGSVPLKEEGLFQRFSNISHESPGSGLGLAIVKQVCNRYGWEVNYSYSQDYHVFTVRF